MLKRKMKKKIDQFRASHYKGPQMRAARPEKPTKFRPIYVSATTHKMIKTLAALTDRDMRDVIDDLVPALDRMLQKAAKPDRANGR